MVCSTGGSGACFARRIILTHLRLRACRRGSGRIICREPESTWRNPKALKTPSRSELHCFCQGAWTACSWSDLGLAHRGCRNPSLSPPNGSPQHGAERHINTQGARGTTSMMNFETPEEQEQNDKERNREGGRRRES